MLGKGRVLAVEVVISDEVPPSVGAGVNAARAASELAAGRPVIVSAAKAGALVFPAELLTGERLAALRAIGQPVLLLAPNRAATLRLRQYTDEAVAVACDEGWMADFITALADPAKDLDYALRGPLTALREPLSPEQLAAYRLVKAAGFLPAAILVPAAKPHDLTAQGFLEVDAAGLAFGAAEPRLVARLVTSARLPLAPGLATELIGFRVEPDSLWGEDDAYAHYALAIGNPAEIPLVRIHSECFTGDLLGSLKCDCGEQLRGAIERIGEEGGGFLIYLRQEGRGIGLMNKLRAYHLQDQGLDTVAANERLGFADDERSFAPAARILEALGTKRVRLLTNNPRKVEGLTAAGIEVSERVAHSFPSNPHNAHYLATKRDRGGHLL